MNGLTPSIEKLAGMFASLPGVGKKSAMRMALYMINASDKETEDFINAVRNARKNVRYCSVCQNLSESDICPICDNESRDRTVICVVEDPKAASAIEALNEFRGVYHVLHGVISPIDGIGPEQLQIKELLQRIKDSLKGETIKEVIVATNPSVEGEATALYLSRIISPLGIKVTRLAYGLPVGATLEYADNVTLLRAFEGRTEV